jgi:hypothetical protein
VNEAWILPDDLAQLPVFSLPIFKNRVCAQLAVSIPAVLRDDKHLGTLLFAVKLILDRTAGIKPEDLKPDFDEIMKSPATDTVSSPISRVGSPGGLQGKDSVHVAGFPFGAHVHFKTFVDLQRLNGVNMFGAMEDACDNASAPHQTGPSSAKMSHAVAPYKRKPSSRADSDGMAVISIHGASFGLRTLEPASAGDGLGTTDPAAPAPARGSVKCRFCVGACLCSAGCNPIPIPETLDPRPLDPFLHPKHQALNLKP